MPADISSLVNKMEEYIRKNPHGVSIQDVARQFNISRYESVYALGMLIGSGKVGVRQVGPVKLHYYKSKNEKGGD